MPWRRSPSIAPTPRAAINARTMRRRSTEAERRLWWHLRHRLPVESSHFRRQVALGSYVADFCCLDAKLVVEVDGGGHGHDAQAAYDAQRDAALEAQGFKVLRFSNRAVMTEIDNVLDAVSAALNALLRNFKRNRRLPAVAALPVASEPGGTTPTSNSSPQGGGEWPES